MGYLKSFSSHTDYAAYMANINQIPTLPNVSICGDDRSVHYTKGPVIAVDLGIGTLWANMNVGATSISDPGWYFAWGETPEWSEASGGSRYKMTNEEWGTSASGNSNMWYEAKNTPYYRTINPSEYTFNKYRHPISTYNISGDGRTTLEIVDDAAAAVMGGSWRMPAYDDFTKLIENTHPTTETISGVTYCVLTSTVLGYENSKLYFPLAKLYYRTAKTMGDRQEPNFSIWSSSLANEGGNNYSQLAQCFNISHELVDSQRHFGRNVRGVIKR